MWSPTPNRPWAGRTKSSEATRHSDSQASRRRPQLCPKRRSCRRRARIGELVGRVRDQQCTARSLLLPAARGRTGRVMVASLPDTQLAPPPSPAADMSAWRLHARNTLNCDHDSFRHARAHLLLPTRHALPALSSAGPRAAHIRAPHPRRAATARPDLSTSRSVRTTRFATTFPEVRRLCRPCAPTPIGCRPR